MTNKKGDPRAGTRGSRSACSEEGSAGLFPRPEHQASPDRSEKPTTPKRPTQGRTRRDPERDRAAYQRRKKRQRERREYKKRGREARDQAVRFLSTFYHEIKKRRTGPRPEWVVFPQLWGEGDEHEPWDRAEQCRQVIEAYRKEFGDD